MAPYRYKCSTCSEWHEGIPDIAYAEPYHAAGIPSAERPTRLRLTSDLCSIDERDFFIRCGLLLPIKGTGEQFGWGVWASLSETNFLRYVDHYEEDMSGWDPMFGWLSNRLPGYPDTLNLKLSIQPREKGARPVATLEPIEHPLSVEQREGMTIVRAQELVRPVLHRET